MTLTHTAITVLWKSIWYPTRWWLWLSNPESQLFNQTFLLLPMWQEVPSADPSARLADRLKPQRPWRGETVSGSDHKDHLSWVVFTLSTAILSRLWVWANIPTTPVEPLKCMNLTDLCLPPTQKLIISLDSIWGLLQRVPHFAVTCSFKVCTNTFAKCLNLWSFISIKASWNCSLFGTWLWGN